MYDDYISQAQILSTRYEVDSLGIESRWDEIFGTLSDLSWDLPRGKAPGWDADHPSPNAGLRIDRRDISTSTGMSWGEPL